jgi:integrase/recombinase XerD
MVNHLNPPPASKERKWFSSSLFLKGTPPEREIANTKSQIPSCMKSLQLQSSHYRYLEKAYREYLQILGYAQPTVKKWPEHIREFLHYLENYTPSPSGKAGMGPVEHITSVNVHHVNDFTTYIKRRKSHRKNGSALSANHINTILNAVAVFAKFLNSTGNYFLDITADREQIEAIERTILSVAEIRELYEATFLPHRENTLAMGQRDRAIIALPCFMDAA